jgi:hypothetical protein
MPSTLSCSPGCIPHRAATHTTEVEPCLPLLTWAKPHSVHHPAIPPTQASKRRNVRQAAAATCSTSDTAGLRSPSLPPIMNKRAPLHAASHHTGRSSSCPATHRTLVGGAGLNAPPPDSFLDELEPPRALVPGAPLDTWLTEEDISQAMSLGAPSALLGKGKRIRAVDIAQGPASPLLTHQDLGLSRVLRGLDQPHIKAAMKIRDHSPFFIPLCDVNHWMVLAVDPENRTVQGFDPNNALPKRIVATLTALLRMDGWKVYDVSSLVQCDDHNCGVLVVLFAHLYLALLHPKFLSEPQHFPPSCPVKLGDGEEITGIRRAIAAYFDQPPLAAELRAILTEALIPPPPAPTRTTAVPPTRGRTANRDKHPRRNPPKRSFGVEVPHTQRARGRELRQGLKALFKGKPTGKFTSSLQALHYAECEQLTAMRAETRKAERLVVVQTNMQGVSGKTSAPFAKLQTMLQLLSDNGAHVAVLCETKHTTKHLNALRQLSLLYPGIDMRSSYLDKRAGRGVTILWRKDIPYRHPTCDVDGTNKRSVRLCFEGANGHKLTIAAGYIEKHNNTLTCKEEERAFYRFQEAGIPPPDSPKHLYVLAGDLNTVINPATQRLPPCSNTAEGNEALHRFLRNNFLVEIINFKYPGGGNFTHIHHDNEESKAKLDHIILNDTALNACTAAGHTEKNPIFPSDHGLSGLRLTQQAMVF